MKDTKWENNTNYQNKNQLSQLLNFCFNGVKSLSWLDEIKLNTNECTFIARKDQIIFRDNTKEKYLITKTWL